MSAATIALLVGGLLWFTAVVLLLPLAVASGLDLRRQRARHTAEASETMTDHERTIARVEGLLDDMATNPARHHEAEHLDTADTATVLRFRACWDFLRDPETRTPGQQVGLRHAIDAAEPLLRAVCDEAPKPKRARSEEWPVKADAEPAHPEPTTITERLRALLARLRETVGRRSQR